MLRPQLSDQLLMTLGRQQGPAVDNSQRKLITADAVRSFAEQKQAEDRQAKLALAEEALNTQRGLGEKRLAQNAEQFAQNLDLDRQRQVFGKYRFDTDLALARDEAQKNRRLGDTSTIITGLGLGVEGLRSYQNSQRMKQYQKAYDESIAHYEQLGTETGDFYADWLRRLRAR